MSDKNSKAVAQTCGLFVALVATTIFWWPPIASRLLPTDLVWRNLAAQAADWFFCLSLMAIVYFWEREPLSSLGFKPLRKDNLSAGLGLGGFIMVGLVLWKLVSSQLVQGSGIGSSGAAPSEFPPHFFLWFGPIALLTASFCEEVIYRGYATERLLRITNNRWVAVLLPNFAFALMHWKDGFEKVLFVGTVCLLFQLYYVRYRDLTMTIVAHFLIDSLALLGAMFGVRSG